MAEIAGTARVHSEIKILRATTARDPILVSRTNFVSFVNDMDTLTGIVHLDDYLLDPFFDFAFSYTASVNFLRTCPARKV